MYQMPTPYMTGSQPLVAQYQHTPGQILQPPNPMGGGQQEQQNPMMQMLQMQAMQKLMGQQQPQSVQTSPSANPMSGAMPVGQQLPWQINPGQHPGAQLPWQRPDFDPNAATGNTDSGGLLQSLLGGAGVGVAGGGSFFPSWLTSMFM